MQLCGLDIVFHAHFVTTRHVEASRVTYVTMSESRGLHNGRVIQLKQSSWLVLDDLSTIARSMDASDANAALTRVCEHRTIDVHDLTQAQLVSLESVAEVISGRFERHKSAVAQQIENEMVDELLRLQMV